MSSVTLHTLSYQKRISLHFYTIPAILCALVFTTLALAPPVFADDRPGGNVNDPVVRAVDIAKPAVVRIITQISGRLIVDFQDAATSNVVQVSFPRGTGKVYQATLSGSGTFISSNGDILTADHVVNPPPEVLHELAAQDVADFINQSSQNNPNGAVTPQQVFEALVTGQLKSNAEYDTKESEVFFSTHYSGPLTAGNLNGVPGELHATVDEIKKSSAFNEKDLAIIHVPLTDTPSVLLGDSSKVEQQDELTIIGFPGNADVSDKPTDLLTTSVDKIIVSSIKQNNGADLIQISGNAQPGNSGGPALDSEGKVVGVVSFKLGETSSTSFLQTSNNALEMIKELNLDTKPGKFQQLWSEAFTEYASNTPGHWRKADQLFKQITQQYPLYKGAKIYMDYTSEQAKTEKLPVTPTPQPQNTSPVAFLTSGNGPILAAGGLAVVIATSLLLITFGVARRRRKQKEALAAPSMHQAAGGMMMPPPVQGPQMPVGGPPMAGRSFPGTSAPPPGMNRPGGTYDESLSAFGAPSRPMGPPQAFPGTPPTTLPGGMPQRPLPNTPGTPIGPQQGSGDMLTTTMTLRAWPCGHMNRPNARFCSICGEPQPQGRRIEQ